MTRVMDETALTHKSVLNNGKKKQCGDALRRRLECNRRNALFKCYT